MCDCKKEAPPCFNAYEAMVRQTSKENCNCEICKKETEDKILNIKKEVK